MFKCSCKCNTPGEESKLNGFHNVVSSRGFFFCKIICLAKNEAPLPDVTNLAFLFASATSLPIKPLNPGAPLPKTSPAKLSSKLSP